jgi:hypothetical protein
MIAHDASISQSSFQEISSTPSNELSAFAKCRWEQRRARLFSQLGDFRYSSMIPSNLWWTGITFGP